MKVLQEFKAFAMKGNVIDMAVGIIIGAAFGKKIMPGHVNLDLHYLVLDVMHDIIQFEKNFHLNK
jgi:large conductance mechanosensitive channel protein